MPAKPTDAGPDLKTINVPPTLDERMYCGHSGACMISSGTDPQRIVNTPQEHRMTARGA
jgi:hypothetical protein